ncbi:hypothetical protein N9230_05455, partial [Akkermansiaceae bacterium]|nr:hypothetical protein [Akkermansiaceae bacterium]
QFHKAREAMEADCLTKQLPEDHFLFQSSEDELQEIVVNEFDWSAFDVAHAKRLLNERGVELQNPEEFKAAKIELLEKGKPASGKLLFFGWLFCLTGGLIGIGIGWSLY